MHGPVARPSAVQETVGWLHWSGPWHPGAGPGPALPWWGCAGRGLGTQLVFVPADTVTPGEQPGWGGRPPHAGERGTRALKPLAFPGVRRHPEQTWSLCYLLECPVEEGTTPQTPSSCGPGVRLPPWEPCPCGLRFPTPPFVF